MNIKDLIEAVKFQVSVKPQDEFMAEIAERLETLYNANLKVCSDYDAACDELKKWQKLQPIICPACHRGCFSNDKFCPHCGTSLRNSKAPTEKTSATEMTDNEIIKALKICILGDCSGCDCRCGNVGDCRDTLNKHSLDLINRQRAEIERLKSEITEKTKTVFQKTINKILSIDDHYVIIDDEFVPCELTEEVEHLFKMSISGDNEEVDAETDRVVKEMVGEG